MDARSITVDDAHGDVLVIVIHGEQDIYTAPALRERLEQGLGAESGLIIDLAAATFLDSSILGALLEARRRAHDSGLGFAVALGETPEPGVQRILEITGLVPVFPVVGSRDEALDKIRAATAAGA